MSFQLVHIEWCRSMFESMAPGGTWAVPRSGLVFRKVTSDARTPLPLLVLSELMPAQPEMPLSASELLQYQREDLAAIREHFAAAGIEIRGEVDDVMREDT